ncbi:MAG: NAD(P)-dependent oxidoreductase [Gammaproteobacteria bacterium]|nr:NAD(P)-dependent oxidoreductase [Gammaproteobacteria bacterium]
MSTLAGRTLFITGASRGIGKAIALRAAADGANVAIAAKTVEADARLPGTIHSAAREIEAAGGRALALEVDVRDETRIAAAVERTVEVFGGIDVLVNNASAISLTGTLETPLKRFDLMFAVNVRGTFACSQACIPHLARAANPHILNLAPPLDMSPRWFAAHCAYTMAKYGMSMCVLGMAEELRERGIAVNALWPRTVIYTAALALLPGIERRHCRDAAIVADAAHAVLVRESRSCTGNFFIDEEVLRSEGVRDFARYALEGEADLMTDLFLEGGPALAAQPRSA